MNIVYQNIYQNFKKIYKNYLILISKKNIKKEQTCDRNTVRNYFKIMVIKNN